MEAGQGSFLLSAGNLERLVSKLSRMRGAALKLGQMISFQGTRNSSDSFDVLLMYYRFKNAASTST